MLRSRTGFKSDWTGAERNYSRLHQQVNSFLWQKEKWIFQSMGKYMVKENGTYLFLTGKKMASKEFLLKSNLPSGSKCTQERC